VSALNNSTNWKTTPIRVTGRALDDVVAWLVANPDPKNPIRAGYITVFWELVTTYSQSVGWSVLNGPRRWMRAMYGDDVTQDTVNQVLKTLGYSGPKSNQLPQLEFAREEAPFTARVHRLSRCRALNAAKHYALHSGESRPLSDDSGLHADGNDTARIEDRGQARYALRAIKCQLTAAEWRLLLEDADGSLDKTLATTRTRLRRARQKAMALLREGGYSSLSDVLGGSGNRGRCGSND
jgi:hypothetical protein